MESNEDAVRIVEMTQKDSIYYIKLVGKAAGEFENLVKQSTMGKHYQTTLHDTEESFVKGKVNQCGKFHYYLFFFQRNFQSHPYFQQQPP